MSLNEITVCVMLRASTWKRNGNANFAKSIRGGLCFRDKQEIERDSVKEENILYKGSPQGLKRDIYP